MKTATPQASVLKPAFVIPWVSAKQPDGSFKISPGKPIEWLSAKQLADSIGLNRDTVYRYREEGIIPKTHVKPAGKRKWIFHASVVALLDEFFSRERSLKTDPKTTRLSPP